MHTRSQALICGNALQERRELCPLLVSERSAERVLMLPGESPDHFERLSPLVRQKQSVTAPIVRVVATFDQASRFEFINEDNQAAGQHLQRFAKRLLGDAFRGLHEAQDARVCGRQPDGLKALAEFGRGMGAHLGQ